MANSPSRKPTTRPDSKKASKKATKKAKVAKKAAPKKAAPKKASPKKAAPMPSWKYRRESGKEPGKVIRRIGDNNSITVYIQYKTLSSNTLIDILQHLEILKDTSIIAYYRKTGMPPSLEKMPPMYITYMATGNSIIFKLGGGLLPTIKNIDGNIVITINEKVALPAVVLYFAYLGLAAYQERKSADLDISIKELELEEKQDAKQERENNKKMKDAEKATENLIEYLNKHSEITKFDINKKSFKPLKKGKK